ncbi:MAG: peptidoglycan D,D-transpeptidase FtsI family protein [Solirubrobacterales bacterium]
MNAQIAKLYGLIVLMFAVLIGFTSYWAVFEAEALQDKQVNRRPLLQELQVRRGTIRASDGAVVARSVREGRGASRFFTRRYPQGSLFGHPIGYSFLDRGQSGFERFHNDELLGEESEFTSILDQLQGKRQEGDSIVSSLELDAQQAALEALGGQPGAVVAIEPRTGKVRALVSQPPYNPNQIPDRFSQLNRATGSPLFDRATQSGYAPGSTMKVVTATAALDSGEFTPDSVVDGSSPVEIDGVPLSNSGGQSFGSITLTDALTNSVNTVWAQVGEKLGTETLYRYMDRFGFNSRPQIDLPSDELIPSGVYEGGELLGPGTAVDIGRVAIGQERLFVTPLQMAEVAAAVANGGELMRPQLWERVVDPDGRTVKRLDPTVQSQVMKPETATELNEMMQNVVNDGTAAGVFPSSLQVAGKTGTAELGTGREGCSLPNQAWVIGFAPADDPEIAVAATIECTSSFGAEVAGPIVRAVMESVIEE